jgi:hypothetical protein
LWGPVDTLGACGVLRFETRARLRDAAGVLLDAAIAAHRRKALEKLAKAQSITLPDGC